MTGSLWDVLTFYVYFVFFRCRLTLFRGNSMCLHLTTVTSLTHQRFSLVYYISYTHTHSDDTSSLTVIEWTWDHPYQWIILMLLYIWSDINECNLLVFFHWGIYNSLWIWSLLETRMIIRQPLLVIIGKEYIVIEIEGEAKGWWQC